MANVYVSSVAYASVAQWASATAYSVGQYVRQLATPTAGNERVFKCTTAGTTGGSEPAWSLSNNATTNDGTVVWTQIAGQESEQLAGNWRAPFYSVANVALISGVTTAFVSSDHAETAAAARTINGAGSGVLSYLCVSRLGATLPPTSADETTGATVSTTGANSITFTNAKYMRGFVFQAGSGASTAHIIFNGQSVGGARPQKFEECEFKLTNTGVSSRIQVTDGIFTPMVEWGKGCVATFGSVNQRMEVTFGTFHWHDKSDASALGGANFPTSLIGTGGTNGTRGDITLENLDLSSLTGTLFAVGASQAHRQIARNCKLNSAVTLFSSLTASAEWYGSDAWPSGIDNCDDSANNRSNRFLRVYLRGWTQQNTVVARASGASDGDTPVSWQVSTLASSSLYSPARTPQISKRLTTIGSAVTATVELLYAGVAIPTNAQVWLDVSALDSAGSPLGKTYSTRVATPLTAGTNLTASTKDWTAGSVAAGQNSHAYSVGNFIKLASNPGRIFVCTTAGTSAASEPAAYASAVDGNSISDGTAQFRACWRLKASVSFTPQRKGIIGASVWDALASSTDLYVDPMLGVA